MANHETEWDLFLKALPKDLRTLIQDGVEGIPLPAKDHPVFEIMRQAFEEWDSERQSDESEIEETEDEGKETPEPEHEGIELKDCLDFVKQSNQSMTMTQSLIEKTQKGIQENSDLFLKNSQNHVQRVSEFMTRVESILPQMENNIKTVATWKKWTPWVYSTLGCILIVIIPCFWGYHKASQLAYQTYDKRFAQMEGVTKSNLVTLKELGGMGVTLTLVPDPQNDQYFLNLYNVHEFTGKSDIPGGKAVIFKK